MYEDLETTREVRSAALNLAIKCVTGLTQNIPLDATITGRLIFDAKGTATLVVDLAEVFYNFILRE